MKAVWRRAGLVRERPELLNATRQRQGMPNLFLRSEAENIFHKKSIDAS